MTDTAHLNEFYQGHGGKDGVRGACMMNQTTAAEYVVIWRAT